AFGRTLAGASFPPAWAEQRSWALAKMRVGNERRRREVYAYTALPWHYAVKQQKREKILP
ncbi:MAG: hypothetical protein KGK15_08970, partial [Burkholderiales bacterium]|nr:hypothetical protein [Burkholderiales bacterium]